MAKHTLVIGASTNPERYAYKATKALLNSGHSVTALGLREGEIDGVTIHTQKELFPNIDTVTLYVSAKNQGEYMDYIKQLKPRRVIFNPGTENQEALQEFEAAGIQCEEACTLVLLSIDQY